MFFFSPCQGVRHELKIIHVYIHPSFEHLLEKILAFSLASIQVFKLIFVCRRIPALELRARAQVFDAAARLIIKCYI